MSVKKIFFDVASIIKLFIILIFLISNSKGEENNIKHYSSDKGIISLMYHRFNESKYPSTNIQINIFKEHIKIIKKLIKISNFQVILLLDIQVKVIKITKIL